MRTIPVTVLPMYQSSVLTLAKLWRITRTDGAVFGFTDLDRDLVYDGVTYLAGTGITPSATQSSSDFGVDNLNVDSVLTADTINERDLKVGLWDGARVDLWEVNFEDLTAGHVVLRTGTLGEVKSGRIAFSAELRGLTQRLQNNVGRIYTPACDATLGDARCGVDLTPLIVTGAVTTVDSQVAFVSTDLGDKPDGYFQNGVVTFTSGQNAGYRVEIISYTAATHRVALYLPARFPIALGDTFSMVPGCDKALKTCREKFNNQANFRGFPSIPGPDMLTSGSGPGESDNNTD